MLISAPFKWTVTALAVRALDHQDEGPPKDQ